MASATDQSSPLNQVSSQRVALTVALAFISFIVLGMPGGLINIAWTSIQRLFSLPAEQIGTLLLASQIGYIASSFASGQIAKRFGNDALLIGGGLFAAVGLAGYAVAPAWAILLLVGIVAGLGGGALDAGMNSFFAMNFGPRLMNWLHASFGLGSTLGALTITGILGIGGSWRWGYVFVALIQGGVMLSFLLTRQRWRIGAESEDQDPPSSVSIDTPQVSTQVSPQASTRARPQVPITPLDVLPGIAIFFLIAGLEMTAGQWSFALFTERGITPTAAGLWVSIYWASFTAGRVFFGIFANRIPMLVALRGSMVGLIVGSLLLWLNAPGWSGFVGLILLGLGIAPIFPLLITATPTRLGRKMAVQVIGYQVAAAGLGIGLLPGLGGFLVERITVEAVPPFLLILAITLFLLHEFLQWRRPV